MKEVQFFLNRTSVIIFFLIIVSIPLILPFFHNGYFPTHDGEWAVIRLGDMFRLLRDLQFPARYSGELNFGYGYPLFNFAYPFPYYLGILLHFLNIGFVDSIKILFALSVPLSAIAMFFCVRAFWKNVWSGIVAALLYIYYPYRVVDLYVRGSIGESLSFVLFPLIIYFGIKIIESNNPSRHIFFSTLSFAALIMTHNVMTVLFLPIIFIFILLLYLENKKRAILFFVSLVGGMLLSAFFWIPAIFEKNLILLSKIPIADRSLYFATVEQLIFPKYGYASPTNSDGFSYQIGIVHLVVFSVIVLLLMLYRKNKIKDKMFRSAAIISGTIFFMVFLMFKSSALLWNFPLLSEINYPWIILGPLGFLICFLAGFICVGFLYGRYIGIILAIISAILLLPYAKPQYYVDRGDMYYLTNAATTTSSQELMPLWVKKLPSEHFKQKVQLEYGDALITNVSYNSRKIIFNVDAKKESLIKINTIYFPGWQAFVNDKQVNITYSNPQGIIEILIPSGTYTIRAELKETTMRLISDMISVISMVGLLFFVMKSKRKIA